LGISSKRTTLKKGGKNEKTFNSGPVYFDAIFPGNNSRGQSVEIGPGCRPGIPGPAGSIIRGDAAVFALDI
jgi:hypothetical protein